MVSPTRTRTVGPATPAGRAPARRLAATWLAATVAAGLLAGCGAHPVQSQEHPVIAGVNDQVGDILVRDATLTLTGSTSAVLDVALYNGGQDGDSLTAVSGPGAAGTLPGTSGVPVPAQAAVLLNQAPREVRLTGLRDPLQPGASVQVTLTFAKAGSVDLVVPIVGRREAGQGQAPGSGAASAGPTTPATGTPVSPSPGSAYPGAPSSGSAAPQAPATSASAGGSAPGASPSA